MRWLIDLERAKIVRNYENGHYDFSLYLGIRFYSDKLVIDRKSKTKDSISKILLQLAREDAKKV